MDGIRYLTEVKADKSVGTSAVPQPADRDLGVRRSEVMRALHDHRWTVRRVSDAPALTPPADPAAAVSDLADLLLSIARDPANAHESQERVGELLGSLPPAVRDSLLAQQYRQGEAVLTYAGKRTRGAILGDPHVSPLQVVRTFGETPANDDWVNKLIFGDNLSVLRALRQVKQAGRLKNADGFRVCYIDPPFATKREFSNSDGTTAYADKREGAEFIEFLRERLVLIQDLLAANGTLWLHLDARKVHYAKVVLDEVFGPENFVNEVVWRCTDPKNNVTRSFGSVHQTLLVYSRNPGQHTFNIQRTGRGLGGEKEYDKIMFDNGTGEGVDRYEWMTLLQAEHAGRDLSKGRIFKASDTTAPSPVPPGSSKRFTWRGCNPKNGWRYSEKDLEKYLRTGNLILNKQGKATTKSKILYLDATPEVPLQTIWEGCGTMKGGGGYPTEKPQELLERIVKLSSDPGDMVLDCFSGSGSTLRAAERLDRRWVGVDVGKLAIHTATRDLLKVKREDKATVAPFQVVHGGLYDHQQLLSRPFDDWKAFVLALYDCRPAAYTVGGVDFDGRRGPRGTEKVIVFDWAANPGVVIDDTYLASLHAVLAGHIKRGVVSVIIPMHLAPTLVAETYKSGGLEVRVLRVPPSASVIAASGGIEGFAELSQPASEKQVNLIIKTEGFDFIIPPVMARTLSVVGDKPRVTLTRFDADGRRPADAKLPVDGRDDLAMVLIDYDHIDFDAHFDFEAVVWGAGLAAAKPAWSFTLDPSVLTNRVAITWVDRFGNEVREVIERTEWKGGRK